MGVDCGVLAKSSVLVECSMNVASGIAQTMQLHEMKNIMIKIDGYAYSISAIYY